MHKPKPPFLNKKIHFCLIFGTFSKVSFDRSRWAELRNLVFGILPENFGQFSGLRKKSAIFQGHRFETRDFFLFFKNFNRILPIYIKIPIYIKNYADFNGKWIIVLRCLVSVKFNFLCFNIKKTGAVTKNKHRIAIIPSLLKSA